MTLKEAEVVALSTLKQVMEEKVNTLHIVAYSGNEGITKMV